MAQYHHQGPRQHDRPHAYGGSGQIDIQWTDAVANLKGRGVIWVKCENVCHAHFGSHHLQLREGENTILQLISSLSFSSCQIDVTLTNTPPPPMTEHLVNFPRVTILGNELCKPFSIGNSGDLQGTACAIRVVVQWWKFQPMGCQCASTSKMRWCLAPKGWSLRFKAVLRSLASD